MLILRIVWLLTLIASVTAAGEEVEDMAAAVCYEKKNLGIVGS